jgi:hypothetical protein
VGSNPEKTGLLIQAYFMTRRGFSGMLAAAAVVPAFESRDACRVVTLEAIAGVRLPETLAIATAFPEKLRRGVWELRTYRGVAPTLASDHTEICPRSGIRPLLRAANGPDLTYLIPFESLSARDRAWTALNADPRWASACTRFQSYHFGLYRPV